MILDSIQITEMSFSLVWCIKDSECKNKDLLAVNNGLTCTSMLSIVLHVYNSNWILTNSTSSVILLLTKAQHLYEQMALTLDINIHIVNIISHLGTHNKLYIKASFSIIIIDDTIHYMVSGAKISLRQTQR